MAWKCGKCDGMNVPEHSRHCPKRNPEAKTFRQTVEEIQEFCLKNCTMTPVDCVKCRTDRICEAVLKMTEGVPDASELFEKQERRDGCSAQLSVCKLYWRKQVE